MFMQGLNSMLPADCWTRQASYTNTTSNKNTERLLTLLRNLGLNNAPINIYIQHRSHDKGDWSLVIEPKLGRALEIQFEADINNSIRYYDPKNIIDATELYKIEDQFAKKILLEAITKLKKGRDPELTTLRRYRPIIDVLKAGLSLTETTSWDAFVPGGDWYNSDCSLEKFKETFRLTDEHHFKRAAYTKFIVILEKLTQKSRSESSSFLNSLHQFKSKMDENSELLLQSAEFTRNSYPQDGSQIAENGEKLRRSLLKTLSTVSAEDILELLEPGEDPAIAQAFLDFINQDDPIQKRARENCGTCLGATSYAVMGAALGFTLSGGIPAAAVLAGGAGGTAYLVTPSGTAKSLGNNTATMLRNYLPENYSYLASYVGGVVESTSSWIPFMAAGVAAAAADAIVGKDCLAEENAGPRPDHSEPIAQPIHLLQIEMVDKTYEAPEQLELEIKGVDDPITVEAKSGEAFIKSPEFRELIQEGKVKRQFYFYN